MKFHSMCTLSVFKNFSGEEEFNLQFRVEGFNALNIKNPDNADGNASTGNRNFGRITSISGTPWDVQLVVRLIF